MLLQHRIQQRVGGFALGVGEVVLGVGVGDGQAGSGVVQGVDFACNGAADTLW